MRATIAAFALLLFSACGGNEGPLDEIAGDWIYDAGNGQGIGLTINGGGTYVATQAEVTSSTTLRASVEKGRITANGTSLTMTPSESTCRGAAAAAPTTLNYTRNGSFLVLMDADTVISFARNNAPPASGGIALGCFASDGTFTPQGLAPVN